jgi:exopolyphosphatase / guanosine-5'-triphosphate,3'-diphosphate pyrophosphatase
MRISSIDIGSNAIRQVIVETNRECFATNQWITLKKYRAPLRLGTDVFEYGSIQPETIRQLVLVFKKMAKFNKKYKVQTSIAVATSAMRDSKNNKAIMNLIKKETGIKITLITGALEAKYIQQSIIKSNLINFDNSLLIDIGGGSLELTAVRELQVKESGSFPLGVVRLMNKMRKQKITLQEQALKYIQPFSQKVKSTEFSIAIGTGGNFDALSKLKMDLLKKTPQTNLTLPEIKEIYFLWKKLSLKQRLSLHIRKDRVDVLDVAIPLIIFILEKFKIHRLKIPNTGLKEGVIQSYLS